MSVCLDCYSSSSCDFKSCSFVHCFKIFGDISNLIYVAAFIILSFQRAFVAEQSIKLDNRVAALLLFRSAPLEVIDLELYPALYELTHFVEVSFC